MSDIKQSNKLAMERKLAEIISKFLGANVIDKRAIVSGSGLGYISFAVTAIMSFVIIPIILQYIGAGGYGLWATLSSLIGYMGLLNLGLADATVKYTAELRARKETDRLKKLTATSFLIFILLGILILLLSAGLAPLVPQLFGITQDLSFVSQVAFVIMGFNLGLGLQNGVLSSIILGYQRADFLKLLRIFQAVLNAVLVIVFLRLGLGLIGVVFASTCTIIALIISCYVFIRCKDYPISLDPRLADKKTLLSIAPFSLRVFVLSLTSQVLYRTDNIVIAAILGVSMVAPYDIMYKLCFMAASLSVMFSDVLYPTFSRLYALNDFDGLRNLLLKVLNISLGITTIFAIYLHVWGPLFLRLWVGEETFAGRSVLIILVMINFLHALGPAYTVLKGMGKIKEVMYSSIADATLRLVLSIILAKQIGLLGVALGTLIALLCTDTWVTIWALLRYIKLPLRKFVVSGVLPPLLPGIPAGFAVWMIQHLLPEGILSLLIGGVLLVIIYIMFYCSMFYLGPPSMNVLYRATKN